MPNESYPKKHWWIVLVALPLILVLVEKIPIESLISKKDPNTKTTLMKPKSVEPNSGDLSFMQDKVQRGKPKDLTEADFDRVASQLKIETATLIAFARVEGRETGFLKDGRPSISFEGHHFHNFTKGQFADYSDVSHPTWTKNHSKIGSAEYARLSKAYSLSEHGALMATAWGMFEILGKHYKAAGFLNVESFVNAQFVSEGQQLETLGVYIASKELLLESLRNKDWDQVASEYNGKKSINIYGKKLREAYQDASVITPPG